MAVREHDKPADQDDSSGRHNGFRLIGDAYVNGIMDSDQPDNQLVGDLEGRRVRKFWFR